MPRGDGTGPEGRGPLTGRRMGFCAGNDRPGFMEPSFGRGLRRGFRRGFARRISTPVIPVYQEPLYPQQLTNEQEIQMLDQEVKAIEQEEKALNNELTEIKKRIKELKSQK